jgi:outer membrane protein assembly factor BamB
LAIRADGRGDVTDSHVAWRYEGPEVPQEPSPVLTDDLLYVVNNRGIATCFDAGTGAIVWSERVGGNFVASPILADGLLYLCSTQGKTTILRAGRTFEEVASNALEGGFMASPAVAGKALILRTETHLYRIEDP